MVYYSSSTLLAAQNCASSEDSIPYTDELWSPPAEKAWKPTAVNLAEEKKLLDNYFMAKSSSYKFTSWMKNTTYGSSVAPHGFDVRNCDII